MATVKTTPNLNKTDLEYVEVAAEVATIVSDVRGVIPGALAERYTQLKESLGETRCEELALVVDSRA